MSSKKKKHVGDNNSSNRNLDGRRIRTVNEAKALAEYLALKPEMETKEKEARSKRWQQVVDQAEKREEEIRGGNKARVDGKWVEDKEEAGERAREAVKLAMASGAYRDNLTTARESSGSQEDDSTNPTSEGSDIDMPEAETNRSKALPLNSTPAPTVSFRTYYGFDEDDEYLSDDSGEEKEVPGSKKTYG